MKDLKFHSVSATNFLCFGPEGVRIEFDKLGPITFIRGENRDVKPIDGSLPNDEVRTSSNGSGKSSIIELLVYGLYGKTVKKPSAIKVDGVIHNLVGNNCEVEVIWDKYRLLRTRSTKNSLRLWESDNGIWNDDTEITRGGMAETQSKIDSVLGLTYEAFINISVFTDDQSICFLEATGPVKREIVENLLSLGIYRERQEKASALLKEAKSQISLLSKEFDLLENNKLDSERRLNQALQKEETWKSSKKQEYQNILLQIDEKTNKLKNTDTGNALLLYQQALSRISEINTEIISLESNQELLKTQIAAGKKKEDSLKEDCKSLKEKSDDIKREIDSNKRKILEIQKHISALQQNKHGTICDYCCGVVDQLNCAGVIAKDQEEIDNINKESLLLSENFDNLLAQIKVNTTNQSKLRDLLDPKEKQVSNIDLNLRKLRAELVEKSKIREPKADSIELLLQQEIEQLRKQAEERKQEVEGSTPYEEIITSEKIELLQAQQSCEKKKKQVKDIESKLPYYQYWQTGFGEKGIRKYVIDGIIPQLNNRIAYWLQFLIDNKIVLTFDNELNEKIERNPADGDPYIYHAMSAGQRRRLNLAVSQAFADIMMLSSGRSPSLTFLDEVTTNIDQQGIFGIYNMIQELSQDKQVFITTHDLNMIKMLSGCSTIDLVHENGFTKIVNQK